MKYIKTYEHLVIDFEDKILYGEYLKDKMELISGADGYIDFKFYRDDFYPNEVEYVFNFKDDADLSKINKYISKNKIKSKIRFYKNGSAF